MAPPIDLEPPILFNLNAVNFSELCVCDRFLIKSMNLIKFSSRERNEIKSLQSCNICRYTIIGINRTRIDKGVEWLCQEYA